MKSITERIDSISIYKAEDEVFNPGKRMSVWASEGNTIFPLIYIHKPKGLSLKDWEIIKEKLQISLLK
jgi:hypothetical protein